MEELFKLYKKIYENIGKIAECVGFKLKSQLFEDGKENLTSMLIFKNHKSAYEYFYFLIEELNQIFDYLEGKRDKLDVLEYEISEQAKKEKLPRIMPRIIGLKKWEKILKEEKGREKYKELGEFLKEFDRQLKEILEELC